MNEQSSLVTTGIIMNLLLYLRYFPVYSITLSILHFYIVSSSMIGTIYELIFKYHEFFALHSRSTQHLFLLVFLQCILNKALRVSHPISSMTFSFKFISTCSLCLLEYVGRLQLYRFQVSSGPPKWIHPQSSKHLAIRLELWFHPYTSRGNGITCLRLSTFKDVRPSLLGQAVENKV